MTTHSARSRKRVPRSMGIKKVAMKATTAFSIPTTRLVLWSPILGSSTRGKSRLATSAPT